MGPFEAVHVVVTDFWNFYRVACHCGDQTFPDPHCPRRGCSGLSSFCIVGLEMTFFFRRIFVEIQILS